MASAPPGSSLDTSLDWSEPGGPPAIPPRLGGRNRFIASLKNSLGLRRATLEFFARSATVGDFIEVPIVAGRTVYFVNSAAGIRRVLIDNLHGYSRRDNLEMPMFRDVVGRGLLATDAQLWTTLRRLHSRPFSERQVAALQQVISRKALHVLSSWSSWRASDEYIDLFPRLVALTAAVSVKCFFDYDLSESSALALATALMTGQDHVFAELLAAVRTPLWVPSPLNLRYRRGLAVVEELFHRIVAARLADPDKPRDDLLSGLLAYRDPVTQKPLDARELRDQVVTAFVAAPENMATALAWSLHEIAWHPEVLVGFATLDDDLASAARADSYASRFLREVLRLYPGVPVITRRALADDRIGDHVIPKGGLVVILPYVIHRDARFWSRPAEFDMNRSEYDRLGSGDGRFRYIPFGIGPRKCIGDHFSRLLVAIVFVMLVRRYEVEADPSRRAVPRPRVNLRPAAGMWMRIRERAAHLHQTGADGRSHHAPRGSARGPVAG